MLVINSTNTSICNVKSFYIEKILSQDTASSPTWSFLELGWCSKGEKPQGKGQKKKKKKLPRNFPSGITTYIFSFPVHLLTGKKKVLPITAFLMSSPEDTHFPLLETSVLILWSQSAAVSPREKLQKSLAVSTALNVKRLPMLPFQH